MQQYWLGANSLESLFASSRKKPGGPCGQQPDHEPAACSGSEVSQQHPGLFQQKHCRQIAGPDNFPLSGTCEAAAAAMSPALVFPA